MRVGHRNSVGGAPRVSAVAVAAKLMRRHPTAATYRRRMSRGAVAQSQLKRVYESVLSKDVRPFLKARGFTKSGPTFRRSRAPLIDMLNFQEDWHNGTMSWHGFFINVGLGSAEIDAACPGHGRVLHPAGGFLLRRRWEDLIPDAPYELRFDHQTDMSEFADALCEGLDMVLVELEKFGNTDDLVRYAVENNLLIEYETTCCYLAATGDIGTLADYVNKLSRCFGHQDRWSIFNNTISAVTGNYAETLRDRGLLKAAD